jgi:spore coat protein CotH
MNTTMSMWVRNIVILSLVTCAPAAATAQTTNDLFDPDVVHRMELLVNSRDWEKLKANFQENEYYPADLRWNGVTVRNLGIRSRGLGSRSGTKPGLRVDFDRYTSSQTFLGLKSFILDNLTQDPSGIRETVAMRFFARMGLPSPREAHVQLFVNGEYAGLYGAVESIDKDFLRRVFGEHNGDVENDGYLFEYQYGSAWYFTYPGADLNAYAALFDPVTHENGSAAALYAPLEALLRTINLEPDDRFVTAVSPYLELALFMRHIAIQNVLAQNDGIAGYAGANNFYLYRFENSLRSQFIAWDEDNAFIATQFSILQGHDRNVLIRRAMQVPELRSAYFSALLEAAAAAGGEAGWLDQEIQRQRRLITEFMHADPAKPYTNEQFQAAADELMTFARARMPFVRCEVAKLSAPDTAPALCDASAKP